MFRLLMLIFLLHGLAVPANGQSGHATSLKDTLWQRKAIDTFPYLKTHEGMGRLATNSSVLWVLGMVKSQSDTIGNNLAVMQAYYYNLLANRLGLADSLATAVDARYPDAYQNLQGHYGLRHYVPCFGIHTDSCRKERYLALQYIDYAEAFSTIMPSFHWKWLALQLRNRLPYQKTDRLAYKEDGLTALSQPAWEGATMAFSRKKGSHNLLLSNGARYPLKVLEWVDSLQTWTDVTKETGLDSFPGGHRIYKVDYNLDGLDDLLILRKSSTSRSPAKYFPSLLRNNGKGGFEDVTESSKLLEIERANCACWGDINGDGLPDVFIGNELAPSYWMVQDSSGRFSNKALGLGIQTVKEVVTDCALIDINEDGLMDLYLSIRDGNNKMYVQGILEGGFRFFYNKADSLGMTQPKMMAHTLVYDHNGDGKEDLVVIPDISERSDLVSQLMASELLDPIEPAMVYYSRPFQKALKLSTDTLSPYLTLMRAGILLRTANGHEWLYGGGNATESLLPLMVVNSELPQDMQIQTPDFWPAYVHSASAWQVDEGAPQVTFRGGGQYPFLVNRQVTFNIQKSGGRFHRLFSGNTIPVGTKVEYTLQSPEGKASRHSFHFQAMDSKGFNALQEWVWLPDGYSISEVKAERYIELKEPEIKAPTKRKSKKKKKSRR